jgi:D-3-phosphoglycerate dehydrogenase / 2-oxoglutarate reductase
MKIICITPVKHIDGVYENLCSLGEVIYEPYITYDELKEKIIKPGNAIGTIFTNPNKQTFKLDEDLLKYSTITHIITASTGLNHIDMDYFKIFRVDSLTTEYDIIEKISSTAEHAFALMMSLVRNIPKSFDDVKDGNWDYEKFIGMQLKGKTIGIIGYGRLGKMMKQYCEAFGMIVIVDDPYKGYNNLDLLLGESDVISLHVHANDETRHMFDKKFLVCMKENSYIINTSRGEIVNEKDIIKSLESGHLKGYATDVVCDEFGNIKDSEIIKRSKDLNIIVTPHIGGMTREAQEIAYNGIINKVKESLDD